MEPVPGKHRLLIENLPDAFAYHQLITDNSGNPVDYIYLDVNRAFEEMTGFPEDKVIGNKITELQPEIIEADFDWIGTFGKVALTGKSIRFEQYSEMVDRWYEVTAYSDEPGYFAVIFRDITENKNSEEALKHNSGLITSLLDSIPDLIFYKDLDGIYLGCNVEFALHVGYEKKDIVGKTDYDLYSKEEADAFRENDRHMLELGIKRHNEEWIPYPDGRKVLLDTLKTPYYNAEGKQIGTLGICRDITGRKQTEEAMAFQLKLEKMISQISSSFINLPDEKTGEGINYALQLTGELFDVDRSYVFLFSPDGKKMSNTHEWCNQGVEPQIRILQNLQVNTFPWWLKKLERFETVAVPHVDELPPEAVAEKDILQTQSIQSVLVVPMVCGNKLCGFMGFDAVRQKKVWIDEQISLLRVVSELISTALLKHEASEALRESEEKYRALAESLPDIIMRFDQKGRHLLVSPSVEKVVGIKPSQFIGKTHRELSFAEDMCAFWEDAIEAVFKQGQLLETEFEFEGINGPVIFNWRLVPEFDRSGNVKTVLSISRDITERKQAEQEIEQAHQRLRTVLDSMDYGVYVADMESYDLLFVNSYIQSIWGDISGKKCWQALQAGQTGPCKFCTNDKLLDAEGHSTGLYKWDFYNEISGNWYECRDSTLKWTDGRTVRMEIALDITDRKQAEASLKASEERYSILVQNANEAIVVARDGWNVFCNSTAMEIFGRSESEILSTPFIEFIHHDDRDEVMRRHLKRMDREVTHERYFFRIVTGRGSIKWAEASATVIQWEGKNASLVLISDITERKLSEQKLADYTLELEQLYHQLDAELDKARQVHERILPKSFPAVEGLSFAAHYQPAQILGGDFYDVLQTGNKLIFYLSDVSGHGLDGAMLSVFVKHTIKSYISFAEPENITPAAILHHLAEQFGREDYPDDLYVCVFMAVLDLDSMELSYCSAGLQEALLVQLGSGERMKLHSKGMFITSYLPPDILNLQEDRITLTPGSTIFCNTDGLTEQGSKGAYYMDRLPDVFFQNAHLPAHLVAQAILDDFRRFNNGSLQGKDDITFLVLQVNPAEE